MERPEVRQGVSSDTVVSDFLRTIKCTSQWPVRVRGNLVSPASTRDFWLRGNTAEQPRLFGAYDNAGYKEIVEEAVASDEMFDLL